MKMKLRLSCVALSLCVAACGSNPSADICARGDDCSLIGDQSIEECSQRIDDGLRDGRVSDQEVSRCRDCVIDSSNACADVLTDCLEICGEVYAEIVLGD